MSTRVNSGNSITGLRIAGEAMKILPIRRQKNDKERAVLKKNAFCVVEVPLSVFKSTDYPFGADASPVAESLEAEKISGSASYISDPEVFRRSSAHRGSQINLHGDAYCVIDQPMRFVQRRAS